MTMGNNFCHCMEQLTYTGFCNLWQAKNNYRPSI